MLCQATQLSSYFSGEAFYVFRKCAHEWTTLAQYLPTDTTDKCLACTKVKSYIVFLNNEIK